MKVLIAEDDPHTREGLKALLRAEGYEVQATADGQAAVSAFEKSPADLVCLDVMMPVMDGYRACQGIRAISQAVPILFISAKSEEVDTVLGLELGADDFITKPFGPREVIARVRAAIRRARLSARPATKQQFSLGDLEVFPEELRAQRSGRSIDLSPRDVKILALLQQRPGQAIDRDTFFDECWGLSYLPNSRTLDQHISQLRKKVEVDPSSPALITTVHGVGYRWPDAK